MRTLKTSKARENILARIRKELNKDNLTIPYPEAEQESGKKVFEQPHASNEEVFAENFNALGGRFIYCSSEEEMLRQVSALYKSRKWGKMLCADNNVLQHLGQSSDIYIAIDAQGAPEDAQACITNCELLVARTGSAIITSNQNLGRTSSVFYPTHIIIAYTDQIVYDISDAIKDMKKRYGNNLPSMINLNTGPSRTADIEKTLVVGVHGPGEVFCFLIDRP